MLETKGARYQIRPEAADMLMRYSCELCGGERGLEKSPVLNTFTDQDGDRHVTCTDCAFAAPDELRRRLLASADEAARDGARAAANLRDLAARIVPSDRAEYDRLVDQNDAWWKAEELGLHDPSNDREGACWKGTCHHEIPTPTSSPGGGTGTRTSSPWPAPAGCKCNRCDRPMREFVQLDAWANGTYGSDFVMRPDVDGDCLIFGETREPQRSGTTVRVLIAKGANRNAVKRILEKQLLGLDRTLDLVASDPDKCPF